MERSAKHDWARDARVLFPLPFQNFVPGLLVQEVVYLYHYLDVFFGRLPALAHERVVELLRRWILPLGRLVAWDGGGRAGGGKCDCLIRSGFLRDVGHLVQWINPRSSFVANRALCGSR